MSIISKIAIPGVADPYDIQAYKALSIPLGYVDTTSTATSFTATVSGITSLYDGLTVYLSNTVIAANGAWTLNINNLFKVLVVERMFHNNYIIVKSRINGVLFNMIFQQPPEICDSL